MPQKWVISAVDAAHTSKKEKMIKEMKKEKKILKKGGEEED